MAIKSFNDYNEDQQITEALVAISFILEQYDNNMLNESPEVLEENLHKWMTKFGIHAERGDGLISYVMKFAKGAGKMIVAAMKGDKEQVKELAKSVKKEQVLDFLLKLDTATLHLVSGPLHTIDAITGWHLWANVKHAAEKGKNILTKIKELYGELRAAARKAFSKAPEKIKAINDLEPIISYDK